MQSNIDDTEIELEESWAEQYEQQKQYEDDIAKTWIKKHGGSGVSHLPENNPEQLYRKALNTIFVMDSIIANLESEVSGKQLLLDELHKEKMPTAKRLVCDNTIYTDDKVVPKMRIIDEESNNEKQK